MSKPEPKTQNSSRPAISRAQGRRLRNYYRSAGWPCQDSMEIELLNAGLIERTPGQNATLPDAIRVTDAGLLAIGETLETNRQQFNPHEELVASVAESLALQGRLSYRSLMLRARVDDRWKPCKPDVYSIRNTSVAAYARPVIHEIKVRRADLQSDIRNAEKRAAYQALSSEFFYVMPEGLARLDEIPEDCGVMFATSSGLLLARPSAGRAVELGIAEWMTLARRGAEFLDEEPRQHLLVAPEVVQGPAERKKSS